MLETREALWAIDTAQKVTLLLRQIQKEMVGSGLTKGDRSPVTVADFAAQAIVGRLLDEAFPRDPLVGEESADVLRQADNRPLLEQATRFVRRILPQASESDVCQWVDRGSGESAARFWTLDPVDGTKGFLRGQQYALALALIVDGQVQLGVLGCPQLHDGGRQATEGPGSLLAAHLGQGSWTSPLEGGPFRALQVSPVTDPSRARLCRSLESGHTNETELEQLVRLLRIQADPIRMDSQAKYAVLAAGEAELLLRVPSAAQPDYREKIWDQAAGAIVIEEAGGRVTDLDGKSLDFSHGQTLKENRGVLASNTRLHAAALEAIASLSKRAP